MNYKFDNCNEGSNILLFWAEFQIPNEAKYLLNLLGYMFSYTNENFKNVKTN